MANIFGTKPNQAPLNLNLGSLAYQDQDYVRVGDLYAKNIISGDTNSLGTSPDNAVTISTLRDTSKLASKITSNSGSAQTYVLNLVRDRNDAYGTSGDNASNIGHTVLRIDSGANLNYAYNQELITAYKDTTKVFSVRHDGYLNSVTAKIDDRLQVKNTYADDVNSGDDHLLWVSAPQNHLLGLRNQLWWTSFGANIIEADTSSVDANFGVWNIRFKSDVSNDSVLSLLGNGVGSLGVGTTSTSAKLDVAGDIKVNSLFVIDAETATLTTVTQTPIASFDAATYSSAKFVIQAKNSFTGEVQVTELLVVHDGTTASSTEYGLVHTGAAPIASYDVDIDTGSVRLLATTNSSYSTTYKVTENLITA